MPFLIWVCAVLSKHTKWIISLLAFPPQTSSLQYLDARNTPLLDHSAPFVARALRISGSLAVLHLENSSLSGRPLMLLGKMGRAPWEVTGPSVADILFFFTHISLFFPHFPLSFIFLDSYGSQDEYELAGVVPGR